MECAFIALVRPGCVKRSRVVLVCYSCMKEKHAPPHFFLADTLLCFAKLTSILGLSNRPLDATTARAVLSLCPRLVTFVACIELATPFDAGLVVAALAALEAQSRPLFVDTPGSSLMLALRTAFFQGPVELRFRYAGSELLGSLPDSVTTVSFGDQCSALYGDEGGDRIAAIATVILSHAPSVSRLVVSHQDFSGLAPVDALVRLLLQRTLVLDVRENYVYPTQLQQLVDAAQTRGGRVLW